jgi:SAM-dependent methyltransferase
MESKYKSQGSYVMDSTTGAEMARLIDQDTMITQAIGLFPESLVLDDVYRVLDVACGPGGWIRAAARALPDTQFIGVDVNAAMVDYANAFASVTSLLNASFQVMDITTPFPFSDASFDLVNARLLMAVVYKHLWPTVVKEFARMVRPGGWIVLTEADKGMTANSEAAETFFDLSVQAMVRAGMYAGLSGDGITPHLPEFLAEAGIVQEGTQQHRIDFSYHTPAYGSIVSNLKIALVIVQPFLIKMGCGTQKELEALYEQAMLDLTNEQFQGHMDLTTVWGRKR